jgi:hypothetical protein
MPPGVPGLAFRASEPEAASVPSSATPPNAGIVKTGATGPDGCVVISGPGVAVACAVDGEVPGADVHPALQHPAAIRATVTRKGRYRFIVPAIVAIMM